MHIGVLILILFDQPSITMYFLVTTYYHCSPKDKKLCPVLVEAEYKGVSNIVTKSY